MGFKDFHDLLADGPVLLVCKDLEGAVKSVVDVSYLKCSHIVLLDPEIGCFGNPL
jgi:hypothetical protein